MRVDQSRKKIVCRSDCMEVAMEVEIDLLCGFNLRAPAASGTALHAEDRSERWLARCNDGALANLFKPPHQTNGCDRLAFARDRWSGRRYQDQLATTALADIGFQEIEAELGTDGAAPLIEGFGQIELSGNGFDGQQILLQFILKAVIELPC